MKAAIASFLALGAMASAAIADPAQQSTSPPLRLSPMQMDAVTAGAAVSVAIAEANALGFHVTTDTETRTRVISNRAVDIAIAIAQARATGGSPQATTNAWTSSDGNIVAQRTVHSGFENPWHAFSYTISVTVARNE